jgi:hypothetical protein
MLRWTLLTGALALFGAPGTALAFRTTVPEQLDPAYAAIEEHRAAYEALIGALKGGMDNIDAVDDVEARALDALAITKPTETPHVAAAPFAYVRAHVRTARRVRRRVVRSARRKPDRGARRGLFDSHARQLRPSPATAHPEKRYSDMPRPIGTTFADLLGKLTVGRMLEVRRFGRYPLHRLIDQHGGNGTTLQWLDKLTADCRRKRAASVSDQCHARCPDLPKVV